jgi:Zn-dependent protease
MFFAELARRSGPSAAGVAFIAGALGTPVSLCAHEFGHARAARRTAVTVQKISLGGYGAATHLYGSYRSGNEQLRVALGGPTASLAGAILCLLATPLLPTPAQSASILLACFNALVLAFSLLPLRPLDGYKILTAILWKRSGCEARAQRQLGALFRPAAFVFGVALLPLIVVHPAMGAACAIVAGTVGVESRLAKRRGKGPTVPVRAAAATS